MSRRDTIIVAVLINTGLLIVLFATALKSNSADSMIASHHEAKHKEAFDLSVKKDVIASRALGDEVDQVLSQYAQTQVAEALAATPPVFEKSLVPPGAASSAPSAFVDDLNFAHSSPIISATPSPSAPLANKTPDKQTASNHVEYKVKKGDVLDKIARHHHCSVDQLMKLNHLTSANLKIGQVLQLPQADTKKSPAQTGEAKYYTVKNGDNPWTIAVKNHMKVEELLKLNNLDEEKARRLKPGDQIKIK